MGLNRQAILAADDLKSEEVHVPQWGGSVRIRVMTGLERDELRMEFAKYSNGDAGAFAAVLVASCAVDDEGNRLFTMDDVAALRGKGAAALDGPAAVAMRLNGLGGKAHEEAVKNSESGQSGDSGSD